MRISALFILLSFPVYAQIDTGNGTSPCNETTDFSAGGTFECSRLDINGPLLIPFNPNAAPLIIKVKTDVIIDDNLDISGGDGGSNDVTVGPNSGGQGGPGAGNGGGDNGGGTRFDGIDFLHPASSALGKAAPYDAACGNGGGGGGFASSIPLILTCTGSTMPPGTPGTIVPDSQFKLPLIFRGGFGGGAGGDGPSFFYGAGGGGGGAIRIIAGGNITVTNNGSIDASGGDGGAGGIDGGGGGAGSGGVIYLQSLGDIILDGSLNAQGGIGGSATAAGAVGGNGGLGVIRLEDLDGSITGLIPPPGYASVGSSISPISLGKPSLKSDITCGTIKLNDKNNSAFFQMILGFGLAFIVSFLNNARRRR